METGQQWKACIAEDGAAAWRRGGVAAQRRRPGSQHCDIYMKRVGGTQTFSARRAVHPSICLVQIHELLGKKRGGVSSNV